MLSISDFQPVTLEDKEFFDKHYSKYPQIHSDYLFTTIISWMEYARYHYIFYNENLIILTKIENQYRFRPPIGKRNEGIFKEILKLAKTEQTKYPFGLIDLQTKEWLSDTFPKLNYIPHRDYFEYVYLSSDLAKLSGSNYAKIRNRLNKFKRNYLYDIEIISEDNINEIQNFLKRWCLWRDCESDPLLENERKAIIYSMNNFLELGLSGLVIRIDDVVQAMAVYEQMNNDTVVIHYEKASPDFTEIYKSINNETAKIIHKKFKFINRESDMGIPGLRKAKLSYHPHHMIEVFHVDKKDLIF
jgi:hypothetical protein